MGRTERHRPRARLDELVQRDFLDKTALQPGQAEKLLRLARETQDRADALQRAAALKALSRATGAQLCFRYAGKLQCDAAGATQGVGGSPIV